MSSEIKHPCMVCIHKDKMASNTIANTNANTSGMTLRNGKVIQRYNETIGSPGCGA